MLITGGGELSSAFSGEFLSEGGVGACDVEGGGGVSGVMVKVASYSCSCPRRLSLRLGLFSRRE